MQNGKDGMINMVDLSFFNGKKVFVTGHTGFKGTWLSKVLIDCGAIVSGYALEPEKNSLFRKIDLSSKMMSVIGDIRDIEKLKETMKEFSPEIVIHMAAQPIVIRSYKEPRYTYETNVMGVVNVLECVRECESVKSFLNITTDKVYENNDLDEAFKEDDKLNGHDPYSNSKSCSELITNTYRLSFFKDREIGISTARAGNVLGGGDYADNRIIPDCVRAAKFESEIIVRNPYSIRPYQHVLDAIFAYLLIIEKQYENPDYSGAYNIGPVEDDIITTKKLVNLFCEKWGNGVTWKKSLSDGPYENQFLRLNCDKMKEKFNWNPLWNISQTIEKVVEFEQYNEDKYEECMEKQIKEFCK